MSGNNTLFDSNKGDVTSINIPIGQSTPNPGSFTVVTATQIVASNIQVSNPVQVAGLTPLNPTVAVTATTDTFAAAVAITAKVNVVNTAAFASGSPVALPSAASFLGSEITIFNQTTHTVAVWPQAADQIDVAGTTVAVLLDAGKRAQFFAVLAPNGTTALGQILSAQLGTTSA